MFRVCHALLSVQCSPVVTFWERANLLALVYEVLVCFVIFLCGVLGRVWYLIVLIPDLCLPTYLNDISILLNMWMPLCTMSQS